MKTKEFRVRAYIAFILCAVMILACSFTTSVFAEDTTSSPSDETSEADEVDEVDETELTEITIEEEDSSFSILDILYIPMGFIMRVCYSITNNYAFALLLFALVMQLILLPLGIRQQKGMIKQASLRPKESAIRKKYAGRTDQATQKKMNDELMALYQSENYNPASGCLPLLIQLPIILALFTVVRQPLTYITRLDEGVIDALKSAVEQLGGTLTTSYEEISVITFIRDNGLDGIRSIITNFDELSGITESTVFPDFTMFGVFDLSVIPSNQFIPYILVPILTGAVMLITTMLQRKFTYQSEATQNAQNQSSMKIMMWISPLMCAYFAYIVPSAIGVYWIWRNLLSFLQQVILSKVMPTPKFTEEELLAAEREYLGKKPKKSGGSQGSGSLEGGQKKVYDADHPRPRSLHRIDFEDIPFEEDGTSSSKVTSSAKLNSGKDASGEESTGTSSSKVEGASGEESTDTSSSKADGASGGLIEAAPLKTDTRSDKAAGRKKKKRSDDKAEEESADNSVKTDAEKTAEKEKD
ncbi:MAG: YidC/Oxa1 family membrane protein insertase [Firmicutes bacterium]|nr:YidC/Oxa1 family membrane protein insertase [Bacillota bacterium]